MSNRSGALAKVFVIAFSVLLLTLASFGLGMTVGQHRAPALAALPARAQEASAASAEQTTEGGAGQPPLLDMNLFREAWGLLDKEFYGKLPGGKDVTYAAIRGIVDRLGDPHTSFMDPQNAAIANSDIEGQFEGIGARVEQAEGGGVRITYLFAKQPAEQAGLQVGDVVTAVDGRDVSRLSLTEAISLIRGPRDSHVRLTIQRGTEAPAEYDIKRARIEVPVVETKTLGDGRVAYVSLVEFTGTSPARLGDALQGALLQNPAGLILDLRGNPGGYLDAAVRIGSYFVPEGKVANDNIVLERFKDGSERVYRRQGQYLLGDTPLVVLVDGGSASASEIVAGAIQDAGTGILLGNKTYGKGSVQLINSLSDGSQLRITVAHWFTPKGRGIHGDGLKPDVAVAITKEDTQAQRDPQLDAAVRYLLGDHTNLPTPAITATALPGAVVTPAPAVTPMPTPVLQ